MQYSKFFKVITSLHGFHCCLHVASLSLTPLQLICHVLMHCLWPISIARYTFKSLSICFQGTKHEILCEHVAYLHSSVYCDARPNCLITTVCKYSMVLVITDIIFVLVRFILWRRHSFTSRKLYFCLEPFKCFLHQFNRCAYCTSLELDV